MTNFLKLFVTTTNTVRITLTLLAMQLMVSLADAETITIVSSLPRTGSINAQTTSMVNGIKLAIQEVNSKVGAFTIDYRDWDDASPERGSWDPAVEAANADKAINNPDIMAYIGTYNSGAAKISMPKLNEAGLLMVSPGNTWPGLTKSGLGEPNEPRVYRPSGTVTYFRVVPSDDIQGVVGARWSKELGAKRVFVLNDRELYGKGIAEIYIKEAQTIGLEVAGSEGIDTKASNYRSLAVKIRQTRPDLVYFGGTTQTGAAQIVKDLRASGIKVPYMVPDGCFENAFIDAAGKSAVEGSVYITFGGVPPSELKGEGKRFYEEYKKQFGVEPESYAAYGYEAARVVLEGIKRADKKDRKAIIEAVRTIKNFQGALGTWSFDENGDTSLKTMSGNTVKNGVFEFVKILGE
jgi:branched-chain amino acid transport system substrate-binding protein